MLVLHIEFRSIVHGKCFLPARRSINTKKQPNQINENSIDFIIGNNTNAAAIENEILEPQTSGLVSNFGMSTVGESSVNQDQVIEKAIAYKIRKEADNVFTAVKNRVHDRILTAMDNVVIPRVEIAVKSVTE